MAVRVGDVAHPRGTDGPTRRLCGGGFDARCGVGPSPDARVCRTANYTSNPRPPYAPFEGSTAAETHYPTRHNGGFNLLFYDSHVKWARPSQLRVRNFREPGYGPLVTGYPGE